MVWLFRTSWQWTNPDKPEEYEYNITMATKVDDGFGGQVISMKTFFMEQAAEQGFTLPKVLEQLNAQTIAANDALKAQVAAATEYIGVVQQERDGLKEQLDALKDEYNRQQQYFNETLATKDQTVKELKASMATD